jgi:hypothetical protein
MYACLFFGLALLGVFSIIENIKSGQKLTFFKWHIIAILSLLTLTSLIDFFYEFGYDYKVFQSFIRELGIFTFTNLFFLIAINRIPKFLLFLEAFVLVVYFYLGLKGVQLAGIYKGHITIEVTTLNKVTFFFNTIFTNYNWNANV